MSCKKTFKTRTTYCENKFRLKPDDTSNGNVLILFPHLGFHFLDSVPTGSPLASPQAQGCKTGPEMK